MNSRKFFTTTIAACLSVCATNSYSQDKLPPVPFGQVTPTGWIYQQMRKDIDEGFVGQLDKFVPDLIAEDDIYNKDRLTKLVDSKDVGTHNSGEEWEVQFLWWNSETQSNWWDGYIRHLLLLSHPLRKQQMNEYVLDKLNSADDDGYIGIYGTDLRYQHSTENGELWAQASLFRGLLAYYESTGEQAVLDAVVKAVDVTMTHYPLGHSTPFKASKAFAGVGHGLMFVDILNTLARITGEQGYLDYAVFLYDDYSSHPQPEEDVQLHNLLEPDYKFKGHGVHTYEHLRALTIAAFHSDDTKYTKALGAYLERLEKVTTASGGPIGDEWVAGRHAHHSDTGYEYCSLQELLHAYALLLQRTGETKWADKIEWLLYNAAQGARHPDGKSIAYCKSDNSVDMMGHLDMQNPQGEKRYKYSPAHQDVAVCCIPNAGRIMPYFVQNMWQMNPSLNTLTASLYGPSKFQTRVDESQIHIEQKTAYPFEHEVTFVITVDKPVTFSIDLRKPSWADSASVKGLESSTKDDFIRIKKRWQGTTEFTLSFSDKPEIAEHTQNTFGVHYGPLLYALPLQATVSTGREYAKSFNDLFFKPALTVAKSGMLDYQLSPNSQFEVISPSANLNWGNAPELYGPLFNPNTNESVNVSLRPIGNTILRKVSFQPPTQQQNTTTAY